LPAAMPYNWSLTQLLRWSCVGDGKRSGYYDMFFTDDQMDMAPDEEAMPADPLKVCVSPGTDTALQTYAPDGPNDDDIETTTPIDEYEVLVGPGMDNVLDSLPYGDDQVVQAIVSQAYGDTPDSAVALAGDDVDDFYYILAGPNGVFDTPMDANDMVVDVIIAGPDAECSSPVDDLTSMGKIVVGPDSTANSFVWGPIRASQRKYDMKLDADLQHHLRQAPNCTLTSGSRANGDVSWSPAFAFRSRFYAVYVLGRGAIEKADLGPAATAADIEKNVKLAGETRLEAVYDALKDEVLWQRTQLSEKRALGEPEP
jgi:hypothetical protein